jgi:hypothetical protein
MRNLENLPAEKILNLTVPESLFSKSSHEAKSEYRLLARRWHPDLNRTTEAAGVFAHVSLLYRLARQKVKTGDWQEPAEKVEEETAGTKKLKALDGTIKSIESKTSHRFELGMMYIGDQTVTFEVHNSFKDLYRNGCKQIRELRFQNKSMAIEMGPHLPQILDSFRTATSQVLVLRKTPDQLLLADVHSHFSGKMAPEHVGWILNTLYNISCYLQWAGTTHNAITPLTVFVSPLRHSGMLLGGWWYATPEGERLRALPSEVIPFAPPDVLMNKRADPRLDLESIKAVGRRLLGEASCAHLAADPSLPPRLLDWLRLPSNGNAAEDYRDWKYGVLESCFGRPRFIKLPLDSDVLYKEK